MEQSGNIPLFNIPGTLFRTIPGISLEIFSEYTGNISWECSTNIPRIYICLVGSIVSANVLSIDTFLLSILKAKSLPKHFCWLSMLDKQRIYSESSCCMVCQEKDRFITVKHGLHDFVG